MGLFKLSSFKSISQNKSIASFVAGSIPPDIYKWLFPLQYADSMQNLSSCVCAIIFLVYDFIFIVCCFVWNIDISKGLKNGFPTNSFISKLIASSLPGFNFISCVISIVGDSLSLSSAI